MMMSTEDTDDTATEVSSDASAEAVVASVADTEAGEDVVSAEPVNENFRWYAINTHSGFEDRAKKSLEERIQRLSVEKFFGEILIPKEIVEEIRGGKRRTRKRKFFPGYMLVQMELTDQSRHVVKDTPKISDFVGVINGSMPAPLKDVEVSRLTEQITVGVTKPEITVEYDVGDNVRVVDGPFANFSGSVEEVKPEKQKVSVMVSIFGRSTPVELDFGQVEKADQ